ncbi:MAG: hypothetical protein CEE42_06745 [Promethearchaeota archaeon Loki_b31]|nr:MAG: hypothetical protein CEE42_06745 [Candidatus Lokiarchaeota archaeon Loki_b31]
MFTFFLTIFSVTAYSNIFFAVPTYAKMLTILGTGFLFVNIVFDKAEAILYWKDPGKRPVILNIKMKQSFIETIVVFFVNFIIIILSQFLGLLNFIYEREGMKYFISYYQPPLFETVLIAIITTLSFFVIWTSMYWCVSRFLQIKNYSHDFKKFDIKRLGIFFGGMILLIIFWVVLYIPDMLYKEVKVNGDFSGILFFKEFAQKDYLRILTAEIFILIGLNLLFYFLGDKNLSERDDFVLLEKENSEIKSKKEKYQKRAIEKRFIIAMFEIIIVTLIFMPLFFIFALFYSTIGSILISVPYFLMLGTIIVVFILYGAILTGRISIIKSKSRQSIES